MRQVLCRAGDHCAGEKPEAVRACQLPPCNGRCDTHWFRCSDNGFYSSKSRISGQTLEFLLRSTPLKHEPNPLLSDQCLRQCPPPARHHNPWFLSGANAGVRTGHTCEAAVNLFF